MIDPMVAEVAVESACQQELYKLSHETRVRVTKRLAAKAKHDMKNQPPESDPRQTKMFNDPEH